VTVTAPPRPPRPSDPVTHGEFEALVEALIEEARQRARRRRRRNWAVATAIAIVGAVVFTGLVRSAQSQPASQGLSARSSGPAGAAASKIAFIREPFRGGYGGVLWVMNPDGSGQRRLSPGTAHDGPWSPDGQKIAFVDDGIYVINADGSGLESLASPLPGRCDGRANWDSGPAWSPAGRAIAFTRRFCGFFDGVNTAISEIHVINVDGSEQRLLTRHQARDNDPPELAWSPLGNEIAFVSRPDGDLEIYAVNADGSEQRRLTRNGVRDSNPVWSPDGRKIAYESNWQLWVINADGSGRHRLTQNGGRNFNPAWSPDGRRIAFERRLGRYQEVNWCSGCGGALAFEVWIMNADGSGPRRLTPDSARNRAPSWSPDGRKIAFVSNRDGNQEIYVMNPDGSGQRNLSRTRGPRETSVAWSPGQK
jgi:Tol biopolymer transport system component